MLGKLKIRGKLLAGFLTVAAVLVAVGVMGISSVRSLTGGVTEIREAAPLVERIRRVVANAAGEEPQVDLLDESPPMLLSEQSDLYQSTCTILGQDETVGVSYATDAGWLQSRGVECLLWGPGDIRVAHKPNESIARADLHRGAAILRRFVDHNCAMFHQ